MRGDRREFDVLVAGGGVVGAAAAALLGRAGLRVALAELRRPAPVDPASEIDPRVVAVSPGSRNVLEAAGGWRRLDPARIGPYDRMMVNAGAGEIRFSAHEHGLGQLGWITELPALAAALWQDLEARGEVELLAPARTRGLVLEDGRALVDLDGGRASARILVAADGARSRLRAAAHIATRDWHYNQKAIVCHLETAADNPGIAWQRFTADGPLALLPLPGGRSSVVWSVPSRRADELQAASDERFLYELELAMQDPPFGAPRAATRRYALPLVRREADTLVRGPLVLAGDAARTVHPLAGQGLNLGLLDAAALAEVLDGWQAGEEPFRRLDRYARWRASAGRMTAGGIHLFNEMTAGGQATGRTLLGAGFGLAARLWPVREAFVRRACGLDADSPKLARDEHR